MRRGLLSPSQSSAIGQPAYTSQIFIDKSKLPYVIQSDGWIKIYSANVDDSLMTVYINNIVVASERNSDWNFAVNVVYRLVKKGDIITMNTHGTSCARYGRMDATGEKWGIYFVPFR